MLKKLLDMFRTSAETPPGGTVLHWHEAFAALLVEAAHADGDYAEDERLAIDRALAAAFDIPQDAAQAMRKVGEEAQESASDIYRFSSVVKAATEPEDRAALLQAIWRVILTDGKRDEFEDALMRRLGGLLHVPDAQNGAARLRAQAAIDAETNTAD